MRTFLSLILPLLVQACNAPAKIEVEPQPLLLKSRGEVRSLDVAVRDGRGGLLQDIKVRFTALTPDVVSVDERGAVTARRSGDGEVLIMAGDVSVTAQVRVRIAARIEIEPLNPVLNLGVSQDLHATVYDDRDAPLVTAAPIRWSVSDSNVVSLRGQGTIKTLKEGRATVTAFIGDIRATTVVTVRHEQYQGKSGTWTR